MFQQVVAFFLTSDAQPTFKSLMRKKTDLHFRTGTRHQLAPLLRPTENSNKTCSFSINLLVYTVGFGLFENTYLIFFWCQTLDSLGKQQLILHALLRTMRQVCTIFNIAVVKNCIKWEMYIVVQYNLYFSLIFMHELTKQRGIDSLWSQKYVIV